MEATGDICITWVDRGKDSPTGTGSWENKKWGSEYKKQKNLKKFSINGSKEIRQGPKVTLTQGIDILLGTTSYGDADRKICEPEKIGDTEKREDKYRNKFFFFFF